MRYIARDHSAGARGFVGAIALFLATASHAQISWTLHESSCPEQGVTGEFSCGDYGRFFVDGAGPSADCPALAQGSEIPPAYFPLRNVEPFPDQPINPVSGRAYPTPGTGGELLRPSIHTATGPVPWLALIDFDGAHGLSVNWLAQAVAGSSVASTTFLLDDPATNPGGLVTDINVLRALCDVAQTARRLPHVTPIVNMSFGRAVLATDPLAGKACSEATLSCQIRGVVEHLARRGATLIGAAGKQREWLFPATLESVIDVGQIDPSLFAKTQTVLPTWEMPARTRALMPGNSLCLRGGWAAPSGASYSSAILAGWLAAVLTTSSALKVNDADTLVPEYSAARGCHILTNGEGGELSQCNAYIDTLFDGLDGEFGAHCWQNPVNKTVLTTMGGATMEQPETTGVVKWNALIRPAPEGDPCVPCTGSSAAFLSPAAADLSINLSGTPSMRPELKIESMHLRVDDQFYPLDLDTATLGEFRTGSVDALVIAGAAPLVQSAQSASLFFRVRDAAASHCDEWVGNEPACAWMATHIHTVAAPGGSTD